ncbi:MAG: glycosyltransferase [Lachnospiraceae bacterium]|nr:glycosyltransferase [Lachnospiraceae bacterium]
MERQGKEGNGKDEIAVSVIVPFYNRKEFLEECIESLIRQGHGGEMELILIDDASTDGSMDLCRQYLDAFVHKKLIQHARRRGVAYSRNEGMHAARGQYLFFMDSDDRMEELVFEDVLSALEDGPDLVLFDYVQLLGGQVLEVKKPVGDCREGLLWKEELLENPYWTMQLPAQAWRYVLRRGLCEDCQLQFPQLDYGEDSLFTMDVLACAQTVYYLKKAVYGYRIQVEDSLTSRAQLDQSHMLTYFQARFLKAAEWMRREPEKQAFLQQWVQQWCTQCIRGFLFEMDWLRMVRELGQACQEILPEYLAEVTGGLPVDTYFLRYKYQLLSAMEAAQKVYLLPACEDNVRLAKKLNAQEQVIEAFLDNHTEAGNHNLTYVLEAGYCVQNLRESLSREDHSQSLFVICHWKRVMNSIQQQLAESGIRAEQMILMEW